jgi:hypothetical protein
VSDAKIPIPRERYRLLAEVIRSDQVPPRQLQEILTTDPNFAEWYAITYPRPSR